MTKLWNWAMVGLAGLAVLGTNALGTVAYTEGFQLGTAGVAGNVDNWGWVAQPSGAGINTEYAAAAGSQGSSQSLIFSHDAAGGTMTLHDLKGPWSVSALGPIVTASFDHKNYSAGGGQYTTWSMTVGVVYTDDTTANLTTNFVGEATGSTWIPVTNRWIVSKTIKQITDVQVGLTVPGWLAGMGYTGWGIDSIQVDVGYPATRYVAQGGQTPSGGFTSWATAASNIQDAIDVALVAETVLVSNGVYEVGGLTNYPTGGLLSNRVVIAKDITVRSLNDNPTNTIIRGAWDPATTNGPGAVRCVYLSAGSLIGFTLTHGATLATSTLAAEKQGGGLYVPAINTLVISNCVITGNSAVEGGGACYGLLKHCRVVGNLAGSTGGGAIYSRLTNCTVAGNSTLLNSGGGARLALLDNCILSNNTAMTYGGGMADCTANNCLITSNRSVSYGGASYYDTLNNCTIASNSSGYGGGAWYGTLYNCLLVGNRATSGGGGASYGSILINCTMVGNWAASYGGGTYSATLTNCIVYFNTAGTGNANYIAGTSAHSCTTPLQTGTGNTSSDPRFADTNAGNYRLVTGSPCINKGTNDLAWMATGVDLDGKKRIQSEIVDMGAFEFIPVGSVFSVR